MGIDSRNEFYRAAILKEGIATFEVDFKSGIYSSPLNRPHPSAFVPMVFAALKELRKLPSIDPDRIGVMGYSLGGHMAVDAAFEANRKPWMGDEKGFAAHVAFYPVCKPYLQQEDLRVTGAPMIILYGTEDSYGEGTNVPAFKRLLHEKANFEVTTVGYAGALHAFNHNVPPEDHWDPVAIGHRSHTAWNADAANDSLGQVVSFLRKTLTAK
jgi:dienelactone hydrolase